MAVAENKKANPISRFVNFFGESWAEIKKVHPPSRQETIQTTIAVLMMVILFAVFLGTTDFVVQRIMREVLL